MWEKPGDKTDIPAFGHVMQFDTHLLEDASFMRLKNLTVSYELPKNWLKRQNVINHHTLSSFRLYPVHTTWGLRLPDLHRHILHNRIVTVPRLYKLKYRMA